MEPNQEKQSVDGIKNGANSSNSPTRRLNNPSTQYHPAPLSSKDLGKRESKSASGTSSPQPQGESSDNSTNSASQGGSLAPGDLSQREQTGNDNAPSPSDSPSGGHSKGASPISKIKPASYAKNKVKSTIKKKAVFAIAGAGGGGAAILIAILLIFIASLVIPDFALHMVEWQFARLSLTQETQQAEVLDEKLVTEADPATETELESGDAAGDPMKASMDTYDPQQVLDTTGRANQKDTPIHITVKSTDVTIVDDGQVFPIEGPGTAVGAEHASAIDGNAPATEQAAAVKTVDTGLVATEAPVTDSVRDTLNKGLISEDGGSLGGEDSTKYEGETESEADATVTGEVQTDVLKSASPSPSDVSGDQTTAEQIDNSLKTCAEDPVCAAKEAVDPNYVPPGVTDALNAVTTEAASASSALAAVWEPLVSIGLPLCIIYDSSVINSAGTVDSQSNEAKATALLVNSSADQQKEGKTNGNAVGALAWKIGQLNQTIAEQRASGGNVNTDGQFSPQTPTDGNASTSNNIVTSLFGSGGISGAVAGALSTLCPNITNPAAIGLVLAIQLLGALLSGGTETAAETAADEAANEVATQAADAAAQSAGNSILKTLAKTIFNKKNIITAGAVSAVSLLARGYVALKAGLGAGGLEQGSDFANVADNGNNLLAGDLMRTQYYGRPLTNAETNALKVDSTGQIAKLNNGKSFYQRYFALGNANSLASDVVLNVGSSLNLQSIGSFISRIGSIFQPMSWLTNMFGFTKVAAAGASDNPNIDNQNYGNIQWGYTKAELSLIQSDPTYQPLENHQILTEINNESGGDVNLIQHVYEACFDSSISIGKLLTPSIIYWEPDNWPASSNSAKMSPVEIIPGGPEGAAITRTQVGTEPDGTQDNDTSGNLCSPGALSPAQTGGACYTVDLPHPPRGPYPAPSKYCSDGRTVGTGCYTVPVNGVKQDVCDPVFRWRLDMSYQNLLNQQIDTQNATQPTL